MEKQNQYYIQEQLSYKINFYAVGQGLFSSGHIILENDKYSQQIYLDKVLNRELSKQIVKEHSYFSRDIIKNIARKLIVCLVNKKRKRYEDYLDDCSYIISDYMTKEKARNVAKNIYRFCSDYYFHSFYSINRVKKFHFVYDCGTSSAETLIIKQIDNEFHKNMYGSQVIDLLTISHFDKDHISGLDHLLKTYKVKIILLPFIDLPHRLFLAFYYKVDIKSEFMEFFINPTRYLLKKYEGRIEHIILVPPSNDNGKKSDVPIDAESIDIPNLKFSSIKSERYLGIPIFTLAPKTTLAIENIFQFIPYNDASINPKLTSIFIDEVETQKKKLLDKSGNSSDIKLIIGAIKKIYNKQFGNSAIKRNNISLFLFANPLNHIPEVIEACQYNDESGIERDKDFSFFPTTRNRTKNAILYTGDGYLNDKICLKNLIDYLGEENFKKISCLQVMHHGASSSWYKGLAKEINPFMSVFSADSNRIKPGHPHAEVLRDFITYSPILVDKENSFFVNFY